MGPLISTLLLRLLVRVLSDAVLDVIAEIRHKAHAVVQFDVERLVIDGRPLSIDDFFVALTFVATFAHHSFGFVALDEVDSINVFTGELELVSLIDHLNLVGNRVSAQFLRVKEIDVALVGTHMEIPNTVQFLANAVYWLVSGHELGRLIVVERVSVGH